MSRTAVKEGFGIGNENYRPLFKVNICKAEEVMIKREDSVPIMKGKKLLIRIAVWTADSQASQVPKQNLALFSIYSLL